MGVFREVNKMTNRKGGAMKIQRGLGLLGALFLVLAAGVASAQEIELQLFSNVVSLETVFEEGHEGDITRIIGFNYEQDYLVGDQRIRIATETGEVRLPGGQYLNLMLPVVEVQFTATLTVPEIGNFSSSGTMIGLGGPSAAATGEMSVSWIQSYFDGTDFLAGFYGLGTGTGKMNLFANGGENPFKMVLMPPSGE
jgi:hypothetical protein